MAKLQLKLRNKEIISFCLYLNYGKNLSNSVKKGLLDIGLFITPVSKVL